MKDLIERDKVLHEIDQLSHAWEYGNAVDDCYEIVKKAPTVYAKPVVHGHWDYLDDVYCDSLCSECGTLYTNYENVDFKFCPHCGAQMDGEEE